MHRRFLALLGLVPFAIVHASCDRPTAGTTACPLETTQTSVPTQSPVPLDLLIVVDDAPAMAALAPKLRGDLDRLVRALVTGDVDPASVGLEFPPVHDVRIGFVSPDLGVQGVGTNGETPVVGCGADPSMPGGVDAARAHYGDDAALRRQQTTQHAVPGDPLSSVVVNCDVDGTPGDDAVLPGNLPSFLTFAQPMSGSLLPNEVDEAARRALCLGYAGAAGCSYQQPLEAMLKALTPSAATAALVGGAFHAAAGDTARSLGRGDDATANAGWLRADSMLAVLVVTAGDDCSSTTPLVYDATSSTPAYADAYGVLQQPTRCARHASDLRDTMRYVSGLRALRPGRERLIYFGVVGGLPPSLANDSFTGTLGFDATLADPSLQYVSEARVLPAGPGGSNVSVAAAALTSACSHTVAPTTTVDFSATPSRRLISVAAELSQSGANTQIASLCDDGAFASVARSLLRLLHAPSNAVCLPRTLPRNSSSQVDCDVHLTLGPNVACDTVPGWDGFAAETVPTTDPRDTDGMLQRCGILQLSVTAADRQLGLPPSGTGGWFYDDYTPSLTAHGCAANAMLALDPAARFVDGVASIACRVPVTDPRLWLDRGAPCLQASGCLLPTATDVAELVAVHGLPASFDAATDFVCDPVALTCQFGCDADTDCPSGESCLPIDPLAPTGSRRICGASACLP